MRLWRRRRYREALIRIAGTPTKNSSDEAKTMAAFANKALVSWDDAVAYIEHPSHTLGRQASPHSPPPQAHP
jgi:hypothetical protein